LQPKYSGSYAEGLWLGATNAVPKGTYQIQMEMEIVFTCGPRLKVDTQAGFGMILNATVGVSKKLCVKFFILAHKLEIYFS